MFKAGVFMMRTCAIVLVLPLLLRAQRTFVRNCECEYVTNGKCAYTLLLPIGEGAAAATCQSDATGSGTSSEDLTWIQSQIDSVQTNMTILKDWSSSQSRLLAQLQGAIIGLQTAGGSQTPGDSEPGTTQRPDPGSRPDLDEISRRVDNLGSNVEALRETQTAASGDISSLNVVLTDTVQRVRSLQEEAPERSKKLANHESIIDSLQKELREVRGQFCQNRALLVSGRDASIPETGITASSRFNSLHGPLKVRMNNTASPGAWCPKEPNDAYEWIQFDLGKERMIYGTASKGRYDFEQWVTSYRVEYAVSMETLLWKQIDDAMGDAHVFPGNNDKNSIQTNMFWTPITAQFIRIIPIGVYNNANKCMRADVIGCLDDES